MPSVGRRRFTFFAVESWELSYHLSGPDLVHALAEDRIVLMPIQQDPLGWPSWILVVSDAGIRAKRE
jgi:hypothetical protein